MYIHQRIQEEKRIREAEIKRREAERKLRHEKLARDGKKSFFELEHRASQDVPIEEKPANHKKNDDHEIEPVEKTNIEKSPKEEDVPIETLYGNNENDLNALDYEADKDDNIDEPETILTVQRVELEQKSIKESEKPAKVSKHGDNKEKSNKKDTDSKKIERRRRSRSKEKRSRSKEKRSRSREKRSRDRDRRHPSDSRNRNDRRVFGRGRREFSPQRDNRRRDAQRFKRNRSRSPSYDRSRRQRHRGSR